MLFVLHIYVEMPTIVGILIYMNRQNFMLSRSHNPSLSGARDTVLNKDFLLL